MPAPLANRFIHLEVSTNLDEFKEYALKTEIDDKIISFLNFRPKLLHKIDKNSPSWPSPRSWDIGNKLLNANLDIDPAVGEACASEFRSFVRSIKLYLQLSLSLKERHPQNFLQTCLQNMHLHVL